MEQLLTFMEKRELISFYNPEWNGIPKTWAANFCATEVTFYLKFRVWSSCIVCLFGV